MITVKTRKEKEGNLEYINIVKKIAQYKGQEREVVYLRDSISKSPTSLCDAYAFRRWTWGAMFAKVAKHVVCRYTSYVIKGTTEWCFHYPSFIQYRKVEYDNKTDIVKKGPTTFLKLKSSIIYQLVHHLNK